MSTKCLAITVKIAYCFFFFTRLSACEFSQIAHFYLYMFSLRQLFAFFSLQNHASSKVALPHVALYSYPVSYTHLRAHETDSYLVCRLLLEKKKSRLVPTIIQ